MPLWATILILVFLFLFLFPTMAISAIIYATLLVRNRPDKWGRISSFPEDEEYQRMFDIGLEWNDRYAGRKKPVEIRNDGYRLVGEYFDFGGTKAVIIIPGRTESLLYSYFFAEPYRQAGCNVLVIDNRAHGLSEGKVDSLGYKEYRDIIAWSNYLHDSCGIGQVLLHGICIGGSTALFAAVAKNSSPYIGGIVAEGMYNTFYDSFLNHMLLDKRPIFPFAMEVMLYIRVISGANAVTDGPLRRIGKLKTPILFLHSREDQFSLPEKAEILYDACPAPKRMVWFPKGAHSRIRINDMEGYDGAILRFLTELEAGTL